MPRMTDDHGSEHQTTAEAPTRLMEVELDTVVGAEFGRQRKPIGKRTTRQVSTQAGTLSIFDWYGED